MVRSAGKRGRGELEVSFFRPFYNNYRIIRLLPDYSLAAVTGENMNYLWVLSRTPEAAPESLSEMLNFLKKCGYPVEKLIYPQKNLLQTE